MGKNLRLNASARAETGGGVSRKLRRHGKMPGVVYGPDMETVPIVFETNEMMHILRMPEYETELVSIKIGDSEPVDVLIKDARYHHIGLKLLHVDFYRIKRGSKVTVDVPLVMQGLAIGVKMGGILQVNMRLIKIRSLPRDLIHEIIVDVSEMDVGDSKHIGDLDVPETIEVLEEERRTIAKKAEEEEKEEEELEEAEEDESKEE